jgi:hypothetical protein
LAISSRLPKSVPKRLARAICALSIETKLPELRRPPADKLVKSEKGEVPAVEHWYQRQTRP